MKEETIIKLNKKIQKISELNEVLMKKVKKHREQAEINHNREDYLKRELLKLNPNYCFDNSKKFKIKQSVRKRDNNQCCFCGINIYDVSTDETLHHKIPRRYGGTDEKENLITICLNCHRLLGILIKSVEERCIEFNSQQRGGKR